MCIRLSSFIRSLQVQDDGLNIAWGLGVQVDRLIGQKHLFKRSIILVKAWCYYESRILGAHHGLISTFALETLVLYIFHVFHASLRGPLEVSTLIYWSSSYRTYLHCPGLGW